MPLSRETSYHRSYIHTSSKIVIEYDLPGQYMIYCIYEIDIKGMEMKVTRRSDSGKGGHLLISVPASRVAEVEAALEFLEAKRQQRGSRVVIDLIVRAALRNGWRPPAGGDASPDGSDANTPS